MTHLAKREVGKNKNKITFLAAELVWNISARVGFHPARAITFFLGLDGSGESIELVLGFTGIQGSIRDFFSLPVLVTTFFCKKKAKISKRSTVAKIKPVEGKSLCPCCRFSFTSCLVKLLSQQEVRRQAHTHPWSHTWQPCILALQTANTMSYCACAGRGHFNFRDWTFPANLEVMSRTNNDVSIPTSLLQSAKIFSITQKNNLTVQLRALHFETSLPVCGHHVLSML